MPKPNNFDIPRPFYFESGNTFTGSRDSLNYKIVPKDNNFNVSVWHGFICSDLAEMEDSTEFPISEEGFQNMLQWLETHYQKGKSE